jgi:hypothetical protein
MSLMITCKGAPVVCTARGICSLKDDEDMRVNKPALLELLLVEDLAGVLQNGELN